jgi:Flp pilus assembly protein TadD
LAVLERVSPPNVQSLAARGYVMLDQGDLEGAERLFRAAVTLNAKDAVAHAQLGTFLSRTARFSESAEAFERALEHRPGTDYQGRVGWAKSAAGDYAGAVRAFRKAVVLEPQSAAHHNGLGWALYASGRLDEAEQALVTASTLITQSVWTHHNLAWVYVRQGQLDRAATTMGLAVATSPDRAYWRLNHYLVLRSAGQEADATQTVQSYLTDQQSDDWMVVLVRYYAGDATIEDVRKNSEHSDPIIAATRASEADFYLGAKMLLDGATEAGRMRLGQVRATDLRTFVEYERARHVLKR